MVKDSKLQKESMIYSIDVIIVDLGSDEVSKILTMAHDNQFYTANTVAVTKNNKHTDFLDFLVFRNFYFSYAVYAQV